MFEKILLATDLSPAWDEIVTCAGEFKALGGTEIILTHVITVRFLGRRKGAREAEARPKLDAQKTKLEAQGFTVNSEMPFGLVLSPCASPVLAVILTLAAVQGHVAYGSTLLFAYALGQGTLVILAGTFTGVLDSFLQSQGARFSTYLQKAAGGLIFLAGLYILSQGVRNW